MIGQRNLTLSFTIVPEKFHFPHLEKPSDLISICLGNFLRLSRKDAHLAYFLGPCMCETVSALVNEGIGCYIFLSKFYEGATISSSFI